MAKDLKVKVTSQDPRFTKLTDQGFSTAIFSKTLGALTAIASGYEMTWKSYAQGAMTVPGSPSIFSRGPYVRSIQTADTGPFEKEIFTDFFPHTYIEAGHGEIDLKPGLLHGRSARQGKDGPYTIVSFRHMTRNTFAESFGGLSKKQQQIAQGRGNVMPASIQKMMRTESDIADQKKAMGMSKTGGRSEQLTSGPKPSDRTYAWGARLDSQLTAGKRSKLYKRDKTTNKGYTWKSGKYAGMVRMEASSGKRESRTEYRTFRVISWKTQRDNPNSWIVPPRPPIPIRAATVDFVNQHMHVEDMIAKNLEEDLS